MSATTGLILAVTCLGIVLIVGLGWVIASRAERRRTAQFHAENSAIAEQERQERLATKRRQADRRAEQ